MIRRSNQQKLLQLKEDIARLELEFPLTTIATRTGFKKGNISNMLKGKVSCSENFIEAFYTVFKKELEAAAPAIPSDSSNSQPMVSKSDQLRTIANTLTKLSAALNKLA